MRQQIKKIATSISEKNRILRSFFHIKKATSSEQPENIKDIFTLLYKTNAWGSGESVSGPGSTIEYTENIRKEIPRCINRLGVKVILDAPCGDYNWFQLIRRKDNINYIGGDIVDDLVRANQEKYANQNTKFIHLDIINEELPKADLWLCRDCLFHFSYINILLAIDNFLRSDIHYILTTTHLECKENTDIPTGSSRLLNLHLPPFNFGRALDYIDDWIEGYPVRQLALWERQELRRVLASNKVYKSIARKRLKSPKE